jgi:hypothetical protein
MSDDLAVQNLQFIIQLGKFNDYPLVGVGALNLFQRHRKPSLITRLGRTA